jgi:hypothetical protein
MLGSTAFSWQLPRASSSVLCLGQEVRHRHCIEVEHRRACQPAIAGSPAGDTTYASAGDLPGQALLDLL